VSAARVIAMAVIAASVVVSALSAARKTLRKLRFLMQINSQPAQNLREALLNLQQMKHLHKLLLTRLFMHLCKRLHPPPWLHLQKPR
jgi:hypothetical protein